MADLLIRSEDSTRYLWGRLVRPIPAATRRLATRSVPVSGSPVNGPERRTPKMGEVRKNPASALGR
jgi:hypothetical protein